MYPKRNPLVTLDKKVITSSKPYHCQKLCTQTHNQCSIYFPSGLGAGETMGAVCHRRGFPFLLPLVEHYGVKIAAIVVVVAVADAVVAVDDDDVRHTPAAAIKKLQQELELFWCSAIRTSD